jgi:hypothetical protein
MTPPYPAPGFVGVTGAVEVGSTKGAGGSADHDGIDGQEDPERLGGFGADRALGDEISIFMFSWHDLS